MQNVFKRHIGNGGPLQRRQQHTAQGIPQGDTKATLQRLHHDGGGIFVRGIPSDFHRRGLNQRLPVFLQHTFHL